MSAQAGEDPTQGSDGSPSGGRSAFDEAEVERRLASIVERFPGRYGDEQVASIRKHIEQTVDAARALREIPLDNGDEPAGMFTPYRADAGRPGA